MEDANHLFTSPAKSTKSARSQRKSNATISSSEPMDVEDGGTCFPICSTTIAGGSVQSAMLIEPQTMRPTHDRPSALAAKRVKAFRGRLFTVPTSAPLRGGTRPWIHAHRRDDAWIAPHHHIGPSPSFLISL